MRGASGTSGVTTVAAAPDVSVLTDEMDLAAPLERLRRNGMVAASSVLPLGGNFGNYPFYIGARAGTSLFFNGNLYGLIIRGAASSSAQISNAESYMNSKTGAY